jgi:ferredoxin
VHVPKAVYDTLAPPADEELDMLDLAYDLSDLYVRVHSRSQCKMPVLRRSRLGCQVILTKEMDGLEVKVPRATRDARTL